jgi:hypothetical protein
MRSKTRGLLLAVAILMSTVPVLADDLRDVYKPKYPVPQSVTNPCVELAQAFVELRSAIDITGAQASAAGQNAKGLGYFSSNKQFRSVEDNFIVVNRMLDPSLDQATDVPIAVDQAPAGPGKDAAIELSAAYEKSLKQVKQYALAAVVFQRSAYGRRNAQSKTLGLYSGAEKRNANDREMSADQARAILDGDGSDVKDASRVLKLPEFHWRKACPNAPIPHTNATDSMVAPEIPPMRPSATSSPSN